MVSIMYTTAVPKYACHGKNFADAQSILALVISVIDIAESTAVSLMSVMNSFPNAGMTILNAWGITTSLIV